ncbi:MAG: chloride channel protein [Fibrobacterota bacterium]
MAFLISYYIFKAGMAESTDYGTDKVIEGFYTQDKKLSLRVVPLRILATIITIMFGGSAGKAGPCAQLGAGISGGCAGLLRCDEENRKRLVLCGVSAGFGAVFGAPVAGAFFAGKLIHVRRFSLLSVLPALGASFSGFYSARFFRISYFHQDIPMPLLPDIFLIGDMLLLGAVLGLTAVLFISLLSGVEHGVRKIALPPEIKALLGGSIILIIAQWSGGVYTGLGTGGIASFTAGNAAPPWSAFAKMLATSVTLSTGGYGGIITPIFFIGAGAANFWGQFVGGDPALFSSVGMCAFLAATTNAPLAAIILCMELFGIRLGIPAGAACTVSYLTVAHMSVYPSQMLSGNKTFFMTKKISKPSTPEY